MDIVLLSGSNAGKKTRAAIDQLHQQFQEEEASAHLQLFDLKEIDQIFADGRNYLDYGGELTSMLTAIMQADALVIGFPVFQASIPAALKNVLDMLPPKALLHKAVSIVSTAGSSHHQLVAEYQLKPILSYLKASVVPSYVFIHERYFENGKIISEDVNFRLKDLVYDTLMQIDAIQAMKEREEDLLGF